MERFWLIAIINGVAYDEERDSWDLEEPALTPRWIQRAGFTAC